MNQLSILVEELSNSKLVIQGFNQGAQRAIGIVRLEITIGDLQASTIFHGIRKVNADTKPFTKAESHFADANFYTKSDDVSEVISTEVPVAKDIYKHEQETITTKKSNKGDAPNSQQNDKPMTQTKVGVGYKSFEPVQVTVFHRLSTLTEDDKNQGSTFGSTRLSAFQRLHTTAKKVQFASPTPIIRKSTFKRLSVSITRGQKKPFISVPSKHGLVTRDEEIRNNEPKDEVNVTSYYHVTIEETFDHDIFEEDAKAASLSLENSGQSTIDELKEVNLGIAWTRSKGGRSSLSNQTRASASQASPTMISTRTHFSNRGRGQIRMALADEEKTTFQTSKGIYCYKVVPFGLKNAGATYQRVMQRIFDDMLHKHVECYVDNLIVKSKKKCDHLKILKLVLDHLRKYQLRMNPLKYAFNITSGKFLGFIVRHRGIKVDHSKIDVIQKMPSLKNLYKLK
ncbi:uncharacterized protein E5676_scaffold387G00070 [Cucumis melo var. makuwa]|uniref:Reverse transcriptase domain-containing protein n=1 Tax=Cucumis melo var. makuwa TaxID=1194695 RepID=A0A5D3DGV8_CUCMM|nr:uncharacterized protein E6C27_scaffold4427G00060 [Cucumis melo var. makuwa]TYK22509.1 uncharacterized protein E5676_scaffold387G00070 [Cucumis melo var. makuwa]